jgi:hypothetical protein
VGVLGAGSFTFMALSNPPVAVVGGLVSRIGGYKLSDPIYQGPNLEACLEEGTYYPNVSANLT